MCILPRGLTLTAGLPKSVLFQALPKYLTNLAFRFWTMAGLRISKSPTILNLSKFGLNISTLSAQRQMQAGQFGYSCRLAASACCNMNLTRLLFKLVEMKSKHCVLE